ncbi:MAG: hypothetical protein ACFFE5_09170 [Candidatus Thorarchaeota archaeon]
MIKKKNLVLLSCFIGLMIFSLFIFGNARPPFGDTHSANGCHDSPGGYTISYTEPIRTEINNTFYYVFNISAAGSDLFVQAYPGAKDNDNFNILPSSDKIVDASGDDLDPNPDLMIVIFNVTPIVEQETYTLFILAGNNITGGQQFAYAEIVIGVPPGFDLFSAIFNHLGMYLGLPALLLLSLGTVLVLVNENKFVKIHGFLAGGSLILTAINVIVAFIKIPAAAWLGGYELIYHLPHIILGALGLFTGVLSMLFGIAAERKQAKLTGYITLVCWWGAFLLGYFLNSNLLLI